MANVLVEESYLQAIASAIRSKSSSSNTFTPSEMSQAINNIYIPTLGSKLIVDNGVYTAASDNLDGFSVVTVEVPILEDSWQGTQSQYQALGSYDSNIAYFIVET